MAIDLSTEFTTICVSTVILSSEKISFLTWYVRIGVSLGEMTERNFIFFALIISNLRDADDCSNNKSSITSLPICTMQTPGVIGSPGKWAS